jgi:two-component system chemotaxis response regulator CheY
MDIMMPEMDRKTALRQIRDLETTRGICSTNGAKIIMATALDDIKTVADSFHELCDAYVTKPVDARQLLGLVRSFDLIP